MSSYICKAMHLINCLFFCDKFPYAFIQPVPFDSATEMLRHTKTIPLVKNHSHFFLQLNPLHLISPTQASLILFTVIEWHTSFPFPTFNFMEGCENAGLFVLLTKIWQHYSMFTLLLHPTRSAVSPALSFNKQFARLAYSRFSASPCTVWRAAEWCHS